MFDALKKVLEAFGASAGERASHLGHVLAADWSALKTAVEAGADSAEKEVVHLFVSTASEAPSGVSTEHVAVQLNAGGLHQLQALVALPPAPAPAPEPPAPAPAPEPPAPAPEPPAHTDPLV